MGLHPALVGTDPLCRTCFQDVAKGFRKQNRDPSEAKRGLVDQEGAVVRFISSPSIHLY
jgi:hypothetical protein